MSFEGLDVGDVAKRACAASMEICRYFASHKALAFRAAFVKAFSSS